MLTTANDSTQDILKQVLGESVEPTTLKKLMKDNAKAAGVICLFMIFVNFLCVHCCAVCGGNGGWDWRAVLGGAWIWREVLC